MAQGFGNIKGPHYGLGRINVAAPGTPQPLSQNFTTTDPIANRSPVPATANSIVFAAPSANAGTVYICFKGGSKANLNSVVKDLVAGEFFTLGIAHPSNMFSTSEYVIDADVAGDGCFVSLVVI